MDNTGRLAIVTGAGKGIGREIAIRLSQAGYNLAINYRTSQKQAEITARACRENGAKVILVQADVSSQAGAERLVDESKRVFGRIDLLVNNAGITKDNLIIRMPLEDFEDVLLTNLSSAFNCSKLVARTMIKQRSGSIINISSLVGLRGNKGQVNYSASKAGLIGLTKSLAKELASRKIRVNAVAPGFIETDMTSQLELNDEISKSIALGRLGRPEDIASAVEFLAGDGASYITGQVISVDGGMNI